MNTKMSQAKEEPTREEVLFGNYLISLNKANKIGLLMRVIQDAGQGKDLSEVSVRTFECPPVSESPFVPPSLADNGMSTLPNVSKKLQISMHDDYSLRLVALKKVLAGDVLLVERAAIFTFHPLEELYAPGVRRCHHCVRVVERFVCCPTCDVIVFCGYRCRYYSWNEYHRWECYGMQRGLFRAMSVAYVTLRMLFFGLQFEKDAPSRDYYNESFDYDKFARLAYSIEEKNNTELFTVLRECVDVVLYLIEHTEFFEYIERFPKFRGQPKFKVYSMIGGLLVRYHYQFRQNFIHLKQNFHHALLKLKPDYSADGLFLSTQFFLDSDHPNTIWFQRDNYLVIKACQDIDPGSYITIRRRYDVCNCDCQKCFEMGKVNSFWCKKCKSPFVPIDEPIFNLKVKYFESLKNINTTGIRFMCEKCKKTCNLNDFQLHLEGAAKYLDNYFASVSAESLHNLYDEYKKILNPDHIYLIKVIGYFLQHYFMIKDIHKVIEKTGELLRLTERHYGKVSWISVYTHVYMLHEIMKHCQLHKLFNKPCIRFLQKLLEKSKDNSVLYCFTQETDRIATVISNEAKALGM